MKRNLVWSCDIILKAALSFIFSWTGRKLLCSPNWCHDLFWWFTLWNVFLRCSQMSQKHMLRQKGMLASKAWAPLLSLAFSLKDKSGISCEYLRWTIETNKRQYPATCWKSHVKLIPAQNTRYYNKLNILFKFMPDEPLR